MADKTPPPGGGWMAGTAQLQTRIDALTAAVTKLTDQMASAGSSTPTLNSTAAGGNGSSGTGSANPTPTLNNTAAGGNGANGGWGGAVGAAVGASNWIGSYGTGKLGDMAAISALRQQTSVFGGSESGMLQQAGFGTTLNSIANSASDAAQGQTYMGWASGAWGGSNSLSRGMTGAANMAGFLNPTLGSYGSAQLAQQVYSQQMAMNMYSMGYGLTPRTMSGGTNSITAINRAILQRSYGGKSSVPMNVLSAGMAPGGRLNYNLANLGLQGPALYQMETMISAQNKMANSGVGIGEINKIFTGAAADKKWALNDLTSHGINASSITQTLKNKTSVESQREGYQESGFEAGLRQSVGLLNEFNKALNGIMHGPLGRAIGYASGFSSGLGKLPGQIGGFFNEVTGAISGNVTGGGATALHASGMQNKPQRTPALSQGVTTQAKEAVAWAESQLGTPYEWGGAQPGVGFDCSGLDFWAYGKAGVTLPRVSWDQWDALRQHHSVPLDQVEEGDLIFNAGGDGSHNKPGHVAMMVSNNKLIQSPSPGGHVEVIPYDPNGWDHAARPTGPGTTFGSGSFPADSSNGGSTGGTTGGFGFGGYSEGGSMGSTEEADAISGAIGGGFMGTRVSGGGASGATSTSGKQGGTSGGTSGGGGGIAPPAPTSGAKNVVLGKDYAKGKGWGSGQEWNSLYALWMGESGWSNTAWNPSGAYGIAQALGHAGKGESAVGPRSVGSNKPGTNGAYGGLGLSQLEAQQANAGYTQPQIVWGLEYIKQVYGDPATAYSKWQSRNPHWYARGTNNASPGYAIVGEDGPEMVKFGGGQTVMTAGQTSGMLAQMQSGQGNSRMVGRGGGGINLSVIFQAGSIVLSGAGGSSGMSDSARELSAMIASSLEQEEIIQRLAAGV